MTFTELNYELAKIRGLAQEGSRCNHRDSRLGHRCTIRYRSDRYIGVNESHAFEGHDFEPKPSVQAVLALVALVKEHIRFDSD